MLNRIKTKQGTLVFPTMLRDEIISYEAIEVEVDTESLVSGNLVATVDSIEYADSLNGETFTAEVRNNLKFTSQVKDGKVDFDFELTGQEKRWFETSPTKLTMIKSSAILNATDYASVSSFPSLTFLLTKKG